MTPDRADASAAARQAVYSKHLVITDRDADVIKLTLNAASPHLAAAERETCAILADKHGAGYVVLDMERGAIWHSFADLLREASQP